MKVIRFTLILLFAFLLTSCTTIAQNIGWTGLIILSVILMALFILMFVLIFRRRKQGEKSLAAFSASISTMLEKYEHPQNKIETLKILIERIKEDEKYKKDTTWRNKVLAKTYLHLATQYNLLGDMDNTLATCTQILEFTPDDAMTLYNRGSLYSNVGKNEEALQDLTKSIELVADYASSYNNRGMILTRLQRYDEAMQDFDRALTLEESAVIYYNRANALKDINRKDEALLDFQKALDLCSEDDKDFETEIKNAVKLLSNKDLG